jgi:AsmA protein
MKLTLVIVLPLLLLAALVALLLSRMDVKSRFETLVSGATGLEVAVKGDLSIGLFPSPSVTLMEVTLGNQESRVASFGEADVGVRLWPLLRGQVHISRLMLRNVSVAIERDRNGRFNFARPSQVSRAVPAMSLGRLSLARASLRYVSRQSDSEFTATDCNVDANDVRLTGGSSADVMRHLSISAHVVCAQVRSSRFAGIDADFRVAGERGIFRFTPVTMRIMGGKGSGTLDADFTAAIPAYRIRYAVMQLHVDDLFQSLLPGKVGEGALDFTADLSMHGRDAVEMTRTAQGEASLRGENLQIAIGDLDEKLSRYESSQNFNLVDVGAFFIAGPLGAVATKGYDFAGVFQGTKGNTEIRVLVSDWKVANGVARAQDVAMATKENRLAMRGSLDFVNREFDDVTVAILDHKGCARVEQRIRGPFGKPEVEKPNVLASLTGPISSLFGKAKKLLGGNCEVFYAGSVQP